MIVLNEIGAQYDLVNIDLQNRPEWFMAVSPTGKVPLLQTPDNVTIFESAVINEYLDETHHAGMMPGNPVERAVIRMWRDFMAETYSDIYMVYSSKNEDGARNTAKHLIKKLSRAENEIQGPLFNGEGFTFVDAAATPAFTRLDWISGIDNSLDVFKDLPKTKEWKNALFARQSVKKSIPPNLETVFKQRIRENGSWLGSLVCD